MSFEEWDAMPKSEQWLRVLEWLEVKEAEAAAAEAARDARSAQAAREQLEDGFRRGLGG